MKNYFFSSLIYIFRYLFERRMCDGSGDNTGASRIMSVRSYERIGWLAGLLTTGFNIAFQMHRKATDARVQNRDPRRGSS